MSESAIRKQLDKILAHPLFARSDRMCRFLRLICETALDGKGGCLKEYLIGTEVFDRGPSYDPRVDPIVRVEARRLRSKLKAYYDGPGKSDPVVIELATGGYLPQFDVRSDSKPARTAPTIAVLPFANLSPGEETEYFSDGLTQELIHALTRAPGLRVVAWNTAVQLSQQDIAAIRDQLHVATVLTGTVRLAKKLRVRAQLIDTQSGEYLWSETFDREVQDIFAIQEEIATAIVRTLQVQWSRPATRGRTDVHSYDWYLKGRYLWSRRTPEDLRRSVACFENAILADPHSAIAHAGLADAYSLLTDYGEMPSLEGTAKSRQAAEKAIELDATLAEAYTSLAYVRGQYDWEWEEAEELYLKAVELNPGYATAHHWLGVDHYLTIGEFDNALREIETAIQLDPLSPIMLEGRAYTLTMMRRYDEATAYYRELVAFDPSFYKGWASLGRAYGLMGKYQEAMAMLKQAQTLAPNVPNIPAAIGQLEALAGNASRARAILAQLQGLARTRHVNATCFAVIHLGLGEKEKCLDWLEEGCRLRQASVTTLKVHPLWDDLRSEPRFQEILRRVGFSKTLPNHASK